jgi:hypothetical protein
MLHLNPEGYPRDGPDWVPMDELVQLAAQDEALQSERCVYGVKEFRERFFSKMFSHEAIAGGVGWAIFNDDPPGNVAEQGSLQVLFFSSPYQNRGVEGHVIPLIRLMTIEPFATEDATHFVSQDVTIEPEGSVHYFVHAVEFRDYDQDQREGALKEATAPIFYADGAKLSYVGNWYPMTPTIPLKLLDNPTVRIWPFGNKDAAPKDQLYALDKAIELFESVADSVPMWQLGL